MPRVVWAENVSGICGTVAGKVVELSSDIHSTFLTIQANPHREGIVKSGIILVTIQIILERGDIQRHVGGIFQVVIEGR